MSLRQSVRVSDVDLSREARRIVTDHHRAALEATDILSKKAQKHVQAQMRAAGLGKLDRAVGQTSALKKRQRDPERNAYGVIYARGGDDSRGGKTLESYSRGSLIIPKFRRWLAFPTDAAPRYVSMGGRRRRLEAYDWAAAGLTRTIGKLVFKPVSSRVALLVVRRVSLSPKTGRASKLGKRKPRNRIVPERDVVVFILIKRTSRMKRFDQVQTVRMYADRTPAYIRRILAGYDRSRR